MSTHIFMFKVKVFMTFFNDNRLNIFIQEHSLSLFKYQDKG